MAEETRLESRALVKKPAFLAHFGSRNPVRESRPSEETGFLSSLWQKKPGFTAHPEKKNLLVTTKVQV
ncbi:MAG: hypothetical protein ACRCT1_03085 [Microcoleaceae cyanobacterium]